MPTGPLFKAVRKGNVEVSVSPLHTNLPIYLSRLTQASTQTHTFTCTLIHALRIHTHALTGTHARTTHQLSHSLTHISHTMHARPTHSLTHSLTYHAHTQRHQHTPIQMLHTHTQANTLTLSHSHIPQQVRSLLASGIKPDAERDGVSVFWCRLD